MWQEGHHLPYDGWYGGRVDMMIANGTYADYRPKILRRANNGFYSDKGTAEQRILESKKKLEQWDKQWESIPEEKRVELRNRVADDLEIKEKIIYTARGPARTFRSKPSNNNNLSRQRTDAPNKRRNRLPAGFITKADSGAAVRIPGQQVHPAQLPSVQ